MSTATITSKGQVTIPKEIREALGLRKGDQLVFYVEDGKAIAHPVRHRDVRELAGIIKSDRPWPGMAAVREQYRREVAEHVVSRGLDD
ncbi:MAG TPA: AbrB/MazE/SpoVT family DNA-binding domain-containing protein [Dehalococcoidia bacterium]|nr:AbrB/MazE/SpoVT family DNA-binding domain-containing protein [Dehalococcoidia bacterium]